MATSLFSPSWYRVSGLKPRLRRHVDIHRHDYRDRIWFILQDHAAGRAHRLSPAAYRLLGLMDGKRTVQHLWELANAQLGERAPTQDETIRLLGQLHAADALVCDVPPDCRELFRRYQRYERLKLKQKIWSPMAVRIPIWDPDNFLTATLPVIRPLFSPVGMVLWLVTVTVGVILAMMNFSQITDNVMDRVLTPANLFVLWLVYPVVKAFHELGHGYAVKRNGGEVHEIGIMLLVLIPVPYVDASAASGFRDKRQRMLVGGIGIMVEMVLASLALLFWLNAEPGPAHAIAYNVMLIGGVSTLLFNGNPLLRFDGYFVLADLLEIPNLGTRANRHLGYLIQKYAFGIKEAEPVTHLIGEWIWFVIYGIAAFIYRMFIMFAIIAYIAGKFFIIGVLLAVWAMITQLGVPIMGGIGFLLGSPRLKANRPRAFFVSIATATALLAVGFVIPAPHWTIVDGVTWPSERSQIRAGVNGFVTQVAVEPNVSVGPGQPLIITDDPFLRARVRLLEVQIQALELRRQALDHSDRVQAAMVREEIVTATGELARARDQVSDLIARSPGRGVAVIPNSIDLPGRFVRKGDLLGYVVNAADVTTVRVVVAQEDVDLVRRRTRSVAVLPVGWTSGSVAAQIVRETPGGVAMLPTPVLGSIGGGDVPVDPRDPDGVRTLEPMFEFELRLPEEAAAEYLGRRVKVRFDHGFEPVGFQVYRAVRQLFLRLYDV